MKIDTTKSKAYLVGGGIASLASAVFLIKDGKFQGKDITIFEAKEVVGGSLDAKKNYSDDAYVMTGHRILAKNAFECTYDLLSRIPTINDKNLNVKKEIDDFNKKFETYTKARLVENGKVIDSHSLGLSRRDKLRLIKVFFRKESSMEGERIDECFDSSFFDTNFWLEFSTVFAFQPWHSLVEFRRYIYRSFHALPFPDTMEMAQTTPFSQHDTIVLPILKWLKDRGVNFETETIITDLGVEINNNEKIVKEIYFIKNKKEGKIVVNANDLVFATLGSMTTNASFGSMNSSPKLMKERSSISWNFWENIAKIDPSFGKPKVFDDHAKKSRWESFTITFKNENFLKLMEELTGNKAGTSGGTTIRSSNWIISIVIPHQPHFVNQREDLSVCWGYCLRPNEKGNFVKKEMSKCSGEEILIELIGHLGFNKQKDEIIKSAVCIPCILPYITSQFSPRVKGDRPLVIPPESKNLAFLGQFCEIPDDIVFTVEYSVRSAQSAVYSLLGLKKKVVPIYKGHHYPKNICRVIKTLFR